MKLKLVMFPLFIIVIAMLAAFSGIFATSLPISANVTSSSFILEEYGALNATQVRILEVLSGHAWQKHGQEMNDALDCLKRKGSTMSFKTSGMIDDRGNPLPTSLFLCKDDNGKWFAIVTTIWEKVGADKVARLITGYEVAKHLFPCIEDYLAYVTLKWAASAIPYSISAGQIVIQPVK
jgi:hypothetical protein